MTLSSRSLIYLSIALILLSACNAAPQTATLAPSSVPAATVAPSPVPSVTAPPPTPEPVVPLAEPLPMFRGNLHHTGVYESSAIRAAPELKWKFQAGKSVYSSPIVSEGIVYFGSVDGFFYALAAQTGEPQWQFDSGSPIQSSAALADGLLYFQSHDGYLHALEAHTGEEQWSFDTGIGRSLEYDYLASSPAVSNGIVYIGGGNGTVYALDSQTGREVWKHVALDGAPIRSSPAVVNDRVYIGAGVNLVALDAATGEPQWSFSTLSLIRSSPTVSNGVVYLGDNASRFYAVSADTGEKKWMYSIDYFWIVSSAAVLDETVYVGGDDSYLNAIDIQTGEARWRFKTMGETIWSSPALAEDVAYIGDWNFKGAFNEDGETRWGYLYAVDLATGEQLWKFETGGRIIASPAVEDGWIYFGSEDGYLYALSGR